MSVCKQTPSKNVQLVNRPGENTAMTDKIGYVQPPISKGVSHEHLVDFFGKNSRFQSEADKESVR